MALETFKAQLKAKAKTLGVTNLANKRIDAYAATLEKQYPNLSTDDDHAEKVNSFLELVDIKEIAAYDDYKASKKKDAKQDDKKDTTTNQSGQSADTSQQQTDTVVPDNADPLVKALYEQNKQLMQMVTGLVKKDQTQTITQKLAGHEKLKGIQASFWNKRALPEKEEDIETFVEEVKTDYGQFVQEAKNQGLSIQTPPAGGSGGGQDQQTKEVDPSIKKFGESLAKQNGQVKA